MKLDNYYSSQLVCPNNKVYMTDYIHLFSKGVCPSCGHENGGTFTHCKRVTGKWSRPSLKEIFFEGKRKEFIPEYPKGEPNSTHYSRDNLRRNRYQGRTLNKGK